MISNAPTADASAQHAPDLPAGDEQLLTMTRASKLPWLPRRRHDKPPRPQTLARWAMKGSGGVRLRAVRVGGSLCTTQTWVREFFAACAAARAQGRPVTPPPASPIPSAAEARRSLDRAGIF